MKTMVLAAGEGTRLRDVTDGEIPKPMVEVENKPILEHTLDLLVNFGVEEIIINLHHKGKVIEDYFGNEWKETPITYSWEKKLLGTAGGVKKVEEEFGETFLVVYGDIVTDIDFESFLEFHNRTDGVGSLLTYKEEDNIEESGIIFLDRDKQLKKFIEKPSADTIEKNKDKNFYANGSVFFLEPEVFDFMDSGFLDFSKDVFPKIIESEKNLYGYRLPDNAYWHEVGNPEKLEKLRQDIKRENLSW